MAKAESNLFDLIYPSPVTLQELSSIAVSLELWRSQLNGRRINSTWNGGYEGPSISLKEIMPDVPMPLDNMIQRHTKILGESIIFWLCKPDAQDFFDNNSDNFRILKFVDDFVCDVDGKIHYHRTAKRMLLSDKYSNVEKFRIACNNCFEDDIRLLWPFVSAEMENTLHDVKYELRYWIYWVTNKLDEFDRPEFFRIGYYDDEVNAPDSIDEWMLINNPSPGAVTYFWNRLLPEIRSHYVHTLASNEPLLFDRFYLHKLNEADLNAITAGMRPFHTITNYLHHECVPSYLLYGVAVFNYIKDKISKACFCKIIVHFLKDEIDNLVENPEDENLSHAYCEIWNNAPQNLKSAAIEYIFSSDNVSLEISGLRQFRVVIFLKLLLLSTTFEQRSVFWHKHWFNLISSASAENSYEIMKICCFYDDNISNFCEHTMANCEHFRRYCLTFMNTGKFKSLDDFLKIWFPEERRRIELKQYLIQSLFFGYNFSQWDTLFNAAEQFDLFVDEAYPSDELFHIVKKLAIPSAPNYYRIVVFLKLLLLNATLEQRSEFWQSSFFLFINSIDPTDCLKIMEFYFFGEADMAEFRANTMDNCENTHQYCIKFIRIGNFKLLDIFLEFWFPEVVNRSALKQSVLHLFFLKSKCIAWNVQFDAAEQLESFINDAYFSSTFVNDFKEKVISLPDLIFGLVTSIGLYRFESVMKFINIFEIESTQQVIAQIKTGLMDALKIIMIKDYRFWETEHNGLDEFLTWCLSSEEKVVEFKSSLPIDEIRDLLQKFSPGCLQWLSEFLMGASNRLMENNELGEESCYESNILTVDQDKEMDLDDGLTHD